MKYKMVPSSHPCWCNLTLHAVEQFIKRWAPEKSQQEAAEELISLLSTSKQVDRTKLGDPVFVSGHRPEIRMVVKDRNVCVTVLPAGNLISAYDLYLEELEHLQRAAEENRDRVLAEIAQVEAEIAHVDEQRKFWGNKKNELANHLAKLKHKIKWDL